LAPRFLVPRAPLAVNALRARAANACMDRTQKRNVSMTLRHLLSRD
jgi:hypothetical protein